MLIVCCVNADNYEGRGKEYVELLHDMVWRNLPDGFPGKFVCFTDDPEPYCELIEKRPLHGELEGWWNKLYLFKKDHFEDGDRIIYFDLDTCIVGPLDEIVEYKGNFAILSDVYRPNGLQSSVMMWEANIPLIWDYWIKDGAPTPEGGDQSIIEYYFWPGAVDILQQKFIDAFASFKEQARYEIPMNCRVVFFHGKPRPHEVKDSWVEYLWKIGGSSIHSWKMEGNVDQGVLVSNVRHALEQPCELLSNQYMTPNDHRLLIIGGGPSLEDSLGEIKLLQAGGAIIWALNNSFRYLSEHGIEPNAHILLDARIENESFVPLETSALLLYSAQCHPKVIEKALIASADVIIWCPSISEIFDILREKGLQAAIVAGGSSVGLKALGLAHLFGFKDIHLYGYDSSYRDDKNHAYPQPLNNNDKIIDIAVNDQKFRCAPWMATQTEEFKQSVPGLLRKGMNISVHGEGLLPYVAKLMEVK